VVEMPLVYFRAHTGKVIMHNVKMGPMPLSPNLRHSPHYRQKEGIAKQVNPII